MHISSAFDKPNAKASNTLFNPLKAKDLLGGAYPLPLDEINWGRVDHLADVMRRHAWTNSTMGNGGIHCPILTVNRRLLLGVQRMAACIQAETQFGAVLLEI